MPRPSNPFQVTTLAAGKDFANRSSEVAPLKAVWEAPGRKLVMYGARRMGKTATMEVAAGQVRRAKRPVVVVNLATAVDPADAVRRLDKAGVAIDDIAVRRPTLDDVFIVLTGHAAEPDSEDGEREVATEERVG